MRKDPSENFLKEASRKVSSNSRKIIDHWKANKEWFCRPHSKMTDSEIEDQGSNLLFHLTNYIASGEKDGLFRYVRDEVGTRVSQGYRPEEVEDAIRFWSYIIIRTLRPDFETEDRREKFAEFMSKIFDEILDIVSREAKKLYLADLESEVEERTKQLRESEEKFRSLAEHSPNMIFINNRGRVVYANLRCEEVMGYSRDEFYSQDFDFQALVASEFRERVRSSFSRHMRGEEVPPYECTLLTKDDKRIEAILTTKLMSFGGETAILGVITDITERKEAELALKESEEKYYSLFNEARDGIVLVDWETGQIVDCNPEFERQTGRRLGQLKRMKIWEVRPSKKMEAARRKYLEIRHKGKGGSAEFEFQKPTGEIVPIEFASKVVEIGGKKHIQSISREITERKKAEEAKDRLLSNISHELRTPLTSIEGYTKFMLSGKIGELSEKHEKCLTIIEEESDRLKALIDNFLDLIAIDAEGLRMDVKEVEVAKIIDRLISSMEIEMERKRISLSRKVPGDLGHVRGDEARLHQLFSNLLTNAIKFTPRGGVIEIRSRKDDSSIVVEVSDSGVGIPPDELPHVFERFYQVDSSPTRRYGGMGLGLAICNEIVEAHGGHIEAESKIGSGSVFRVTLPRSKEAMDGEEEDYGG